MTSWVGGCVATFKKRQESDWSGRPGAVSCSHPEQLVDELNLSPNIRTAHSLCLPLPDHVYCLRIPGSFAAAGGARGGVSSANRSRPAILTRTSVPLWILKKVCNFRLPLASRPIFAVDRYLTFIIFSDMLAVS